MWHPLSSYMVAWILHEVSICYWQIPSISKIWPFTTDCPAVQFASNQAGLCIKAMAMSPAFVAVVTHMGTHICDVCSDIFNCGNIHGAGRRRRCGAAVCHATVTANCAQAVSSVWEFKHLRHIDIKIELVFFSSCAKVISLSSLDMTKIRFGWLPVWTWTTTYFNRLFNWVSLF